MNIILVGLGGALGSVTRYGVTLLVGAASGFPWATFTVNVVGSLFLGGLSALVANLSSNAEPVRAFAVIGFCGGFTTFSTFSNDAVRLLEAGKFALAGVYVLGSAVAGLLAVWIGWKGLS